MARPKTVHLTIPGELARQWLKLPNPHGRPNSDVLRPWANGMDVTRRPSDTWIIDFGVNRPESDAALYEAPFQHTFQHVKPMRETNRREAYRQNGGFTGKPPGLRAAMQ